SWMPGRAACRASVFRSSARSHGMPTPKELAAACLQVEWRRRGPRRCRGVRGGLDSGKPWRSLVAVTRKEDPMAVKPVPEGYHTVTPFLTLKDAAGAIEFYKKAFGAQERVRMPTPDGKVAHAELQIGDSVVMLSEALQEPV